MNCPLCLETFEDRRAVKNHLLETCVEDFYGDDKGKGKAEEPKEMEEEKVENEEKECMICFMEEECVKLVCGHYLCVEALSGHVENSIQQDITLVCPSTECDKRIFSPFVKPLVSNDLFERLEKMELRKFLDRETVACPFPNCKNQFIIDEEVKNIFCELCAKFFCKDCKELAHYGANCKEFKKAKMMQDNEAQQQLIKDERWKEKNCRHCPHCQNLVNKLNGCDHMRCGGDPYAYRNIITHNKNKQKGCGKPFTWSKAKPYKSDVNGVVNKLHIDMVYPGRCTRCDKTNDQMFVCLNCEEVRFCETCIGEGRKHENGSHVFYEYSAKITTKAPQIPVIGQGQPVGNPLLDGLFGQQNRNPERNLPYRQQTLHNLKHLMMERRIPGRSRFKTKAEIIERLEEWDREDELH